MKVFKLNNKGITVIELLIAVAILAIITSAMYTVLVTGVKTYNANINQSTSQSGLRAAMMQITKEQRKATAVTPGATSLGLTIGGSTTNYTTSDGRLYYGTNVVATEIAAISSVLDANVLTVTLTASDGSELSTEMHVPK